VSPKREALSELAKKYGSEVVGAVMRMVRGGRGKSLPPVQPRRPEGFLPPGSTTRQQSLLPEGTGSGIVKLRYPAGVPDVNPMTGRRMGGQVYNPNLSGPSTPLPIKRQGDFLIPVNGALVPIGRPPVGPPVSPGGVLNVRALAGAGATLLGMGGGVALFRLQDGNTVKVPVRPDGGFDPAAVSRLIDFSGLGNPTPATRNLDRRETSPAPASSRRSATTGQAGSGSVIQVSDDSRSDYEQAKQNALAAAVYAPDRNFERAVDYYSARRDYANQPDVLENIMEQLIQRDERFADPNTLGAWATANKPLAYELSQQMPQVQTQEVVSEYGSNPVNNLIGSRQGSEVGQAAVARPSIGISAPPVSTIQTRKAFEFPGGDTAIEEEMMKMYGGRPMYGDFPSPGTNAMAGVVRSLGYAG